ncbi:MAG: hypothetical protein JNM72_26675 [Deltaproteobacteria bacterium]|nr:hypothetical protein [Deltaproteobacteria bacterium]
MRRTRALALLSGLLLLITWPVIPQIGQAIWSDPAGEAAAHLWGHHAALAGEGPLWIHSQALGFPSGQAFPLIDPGSLPVVGLGWALGGPALAHNLLALTGVALAGLAGWRWAARIGAPPLPAAAFAMASPPLLSASATGMTEHYLVAVCALQLELAARASRRPLGGTAALAAGVLALCPALGPYNGLWAALLNLGLLAHRAALRGPAGWAPALRLIGINALGLLLALPVVLGALADRLGMSGGAQQRGLPPVELLPETFRGGMQRGADLLDLLLPFPLTGGAAPAPHSAYLGGGVLLLALLAVARRPALRGAAAGVGVCLALSLGAWVQLGGLPVGGHEDPLQGPVGLLTSAWPALGRISRWGRAAALAALALAPLAAAGLPRARDARALLTTVLLIDLVALSPLPWPARLAPLPAVPAAVLAPLPAARPAVFTWPPSTTGAPPPGRWRDETALAQLIHGHPVGGTIMNGPMSPEVERAFARLQRALPAGADLRPSLRPLAEAGFGRLWIDLGRVHLPPESRAALAACLGPPVEESPLALVWELAPRGCLAPPLPVQNNVIDANLNHTTRP